MKNKPILFIDEKPYLDNIEYSRKAKKQIQELKTSLKNYGLEDLFEFYFEEQKNTIDHFKQLKSSGFIKLLKDRKFVIVHASWPDSQDTNPIMPESQIKVLKNSCSDGVGLILFSGSMHLRRRYEGTKQVNRDELYRNVAFFMAKWKIGQENEPFYRILDDGENAYYYEAREIYTEIKKQLIVSKRTLNSSIGTEKKLIQPAQNWKECIGDENFIAICKLAEWQEEKIARAFQAVKKRAYDSPNSYLSDLNKIIERDIRPKL